jgi:pimeloyl-ACP methyl ester carboxylesterase
MPLRSPNPKVTDIEIEVDERRDTAGSRSIRLPVRRHTARQPHLDRVPMFRLGGGPGLSNLRYNPPAALAESRDVVLVGYRGVDGTIKLDAPEVTRALRRTGGDVLSIDSRARVAMAAAAAARRMTAAGIDIAGYTAAEVLDDIDEARRTLGYDQIDLLSESYGTRLALLYAQQHPEAVRRSVLIGVNPPFRFIWDPGVVDSQLLDWTAAWQRVNDQHADVATTFRRAREQLPRRWLGIPIDPGKASVVTFVLLFRRHTGLIAIDAWNSAANGDASGVALLSLAYDLFVPSSFTWGDFLAKAYSLDYETGRDYPQWLDPPDAALGSPLSLLFFGGGAGWPAAAPRDELRKLIPNRVDSLLISGELDISTPPSIARDEALPYLEHGSQVIIPDVSHVDDMWALQPHGMERLVTDFLNTGTVTARFSPAQARLSVPVRLPAIAKGGVSLITAMAATTTLRARARHRRHHRAPMLSSKS